MRILVVEDEIPALKKIVSMLQKVEPGILIAGKTKTIRETVKWLSSNQQPDLILLDIQLSDGMSLKIFDQVTVSCPVIFQTAYDEYILDAFNYNAIDYLLKPVSQARLKEALKKYKKFEQHFSPNYKRLLDELTSRTKIYKERLTVKSGVDFKSIPVSKIAYIFTEHKLSFIVDNQKNKSIIDKTLAELEECLSPVKFFRLNRKFIANINYISNFKPYEKGKLLVALNPPVNEKVVVSQEKASEFKKWIEE